MIHISWCDRTVSSESLLGAFLIANDAQILYTDNDDSYHCANAQADLSSLSVCVSW